MVAHGDGARQTVAVVQVGAPRVLHVAGVSTTKTDDVRAGHAHCGEFAQQHPVTLGKRDQLSSRHHSLHHSHWSPVPAAINE